MPRRFILFDDRASDGDTEKAACMGFEDTLREARKSARDGGGAVIFSFIEGPSSQLGVDYEITDLRLVEVCR